MAARQTPSGRPGRRRWLSGETAALGVILLVALLLRCSYLGELVDAPDFSHPIIDAAFHDYWARGLATGDWTPPDETPDPQISTSPYFRPPGYPLFLALVYLLT
ncbi:MAG: hypothetical protein ACYS7M_11330, partial [Planctomycetota bacterium]